MSRILAFAKYNVHTLCFGIDLFDDNEYNQYIHVKYAVETVIRKFNFQNIKLAKFKCEIYWDFSSLKYSVVLLQVQL